MIILAIFTISAGNFDEGFYLTLQCRKINQDQTREILVDHINGNLIQNQDIVKYYNEYILSYGKFVDPLGIKSSPFEFDEEEENEPNHPLNNFAFDVYGAGQEGVTNYEELRQKCAQATEKLRNQMTTWLDNSIEKLTPIRDKFIEIKIQNNTIEICPVLNISNAIKKEDREILDKLPWHEWTLLTLENPRKEIAISYDNYSVNKTNIKAKKHRSPRILPIFGDPTKLELQNKEKKSILQLKEIAEIQDFLEKPSQQKLVNVLRNDEGWDILIYSGHGKGNKLSIRNLQGNELKDIENALKFAVENGLKIVILNCCDSLKLAQEFLSYGVHLVIAMKEEVIEEVAAHFLETFLRGYAINNKSIYEAVQLARDSLEGFDNKDGEYPCAMFFPVICQNLAIAPPLYRDLSEAKINEPQNLDTQPLINESQNLDTQPVINNIKIEQNKQKKLPLIVTASLISFISILGIRQVGLLEKLELKAYDLMLTSRPIEDLDQRILVITIDEQDLEIARKNNPELYQDDSTISDLMLAQLLDKLKSYKPRVIGLDIFRDIPVGKGRKKLVNQFENYDNLYFICQDIEANKPGTSSPPEANSEFVTLATILPSDSDNIVRRQLLIQDEREGKSSCSATNSLSFQLALHYLSQENYEPKTTLDNQIQINQKVFRQLTNHSGGYHNLDSGGYQILLNYRGKIENSIEKISITDVLKRPELAQQYQNKIILIGYNFSDFNIKNSDVFSTPYGKIRGVFLHAQMVSNILNTALDNHQLIRVLPWWGDSLLILVSGLIGGVIIYSIQRPLNQITTIVITIILSSTTYYLIFWLQGLWLPFIPSILALLMPGIFVTITLKLNSDPAPTP
jgi:CHASE2 domain-containing sensor protein